MKIDAVFSGGGVKAYAFLGALEGIDQAQLEIERVAGTSAGAILAALLSAGYNRGEIEDILLDVDLPRFLDAPFLTGRIPFLKWISVYFKMGLYKGNVFEKWLSTLLAAKGISTFADLPSGHLKLIVSDISLGRLIILPDDLQRVYGIDPTSFSVATAVRMSAGFPYFFMPKKLKGIGGRQSYMVDGGLLSNFPLWLFREKSIDARPVLGITLSDTPENVAPFKIKNAVEMLQALFSTMLQAHDTRYISKTKQANIIFIPVKNIKATNLNITDQDKQALITLGREQSTSFLKKWP